MVWPQTLSPSVQLKHLCSWDSTFKNNCSSRPISQGFSCYLHYMHKAFPVIFTTCLLDWSGPFTHLFRWGKKYLLLAEIPAGIQKKLRIQCTPFYLFIHAVLFSLHHSFIQQFFFVYIFWAENIMMNNQMWSLLLELRVQQGKMIM